MGNYCWNCGAQLVQGTRFCTSCGASLEQEVQNNQPHTPIAPTQYPAPNYSAAVPPVRRKKKVSVILIVVSLLLILLGVQNMSLSIIGKTAAARITKATHDTRSYGNKKPDPNRYRIHYEFFVNGERYTGSANQVFKQGIVSTQTIQVCYLHYWPGINATAKNSKVTGGLVLMGLGMLLLVMGIKGKISFGRRRK
jgi:hypothetical protein